MRKHSKILTWPLILLLTFCGSVPFGFAQDSLSPTSENIPVDEINALTMEVDTLTDEKNYKDAAVAGEKLFLLLSQYMGEADEKTVTAANYLAFIYRELAKFSESSRYYYFVLDYLQKLNGPNDVTVAEILTDLGRLYLDQGEFDMSERYTQRALTIFTEIEGADSLNTATPLLHLGHIATLKKQYADAERYLLQACDRYRDAYDQDHGATQNCLVALAVIYRRTGNYAKAIPLYETALKYYEKEYGEQDLNTASALNNLGLLYGDIGNYKDALAKLERVLEITDDLVGPMHPDAITVLANMGHIYAHSGNYEEAARIYERALDRRMWFHGEEHPYILSDLSGMALAYLHLNEFEKAEPIIRDAIRIALRAYGLNNMITADMISLLGKLHYALGDFPRAQRLLHWSRRITLKQVGPTHPAVAQDLAYIANLFVYQQDYENAVATFRQIFEIENIQIKNVFTSTTENQKLAYIKTITATMMDFLSLAMLGFQDNQDILQTALNVVLARKGIVFDAQARHQEAVINALGNDAGELWQTLTTKRTALIKLYHASPEAMDADSYGRDLAELKSDIGVLENRLSKLTTVTDLADDYNVTSAEVSKALAPNEALVEFLKMRSRKFERGETQFEEHYIALILRSNGNIKLVDLGEATQLEQQLHHSLSILKTAPADDTDATRQIRAAEALYSLLWQPLQAAESRAKAFVISPDASLNLIPFNALRNPAGDYLIESTPISYVTSGRDLAAGDFTAEPLSDLFLAANPDYDGASDPSHPVTLKPTETDSARSSDFEYGFPPLPGTESEAQTIPTIINGQNSIVLTGPQATETAVIAATRPRIMHLATHGFFLKDSPSKQSSSPFNFETVSRTGNNENPLLRSGLVFSGVNHASKAESPRDGVLTALEVTGMNLHGTHLVTLSACETGAGDIRVGEGVFGLRRAFALAGARNLLMSLWPVMDRITANQMQTFYKHFAAGTTPQDALQLVQIETIAELRKEHGMAPPFLWAAFILQRRS